MQVIEIIESKRDNKGWLRKWAKFLCSFCNKIVERQFNAGKKQKSCGCVQYELTSIGLKGKKLTKEHRGNISKSLKGKPSNRLGKKHTEETKQKIREKRKLQKSTKGVRFSEKARQNISKAKIGKKHTDETKQKMKGKIPWNKGIPWSEDIILKLKESHIGKIGILSSNWQGGKSFEEYPKEFKLIKKIILERDNYKCQNPNCKHLSEGLDIHHIDYDKKNNNSKNLITLCDNCHGSSHPKNDRIFWMKYYQTIMLDRLIN